MKLFSDRTADYLRSAGPDDRRYLLFTSIIKVKVTTEGEKVVDLLWDVIAAQGFEADTYFDKGAGSMPYRTSATVLDPPGGSHAVLPVGDGPPRRIEGAPVFGAGTPEGVEQSLRMLRVRQVLGEVVSASGRREFPGSLRGIHRMLGDLECGGHDSTVRGACGTPGAPGSTHAAPIWQP
jgi:hypothetical protein